MAHMAEKIITALELDAAGVTNPPSEETRDAWETRYALRALVATGTLDKLAEIYSLSRSACTGSNEAAKALEGIAGTIKNLHAILSGIEEE